MSQNIFSICNIVATDSEDYQFLIQHLGNYPVKIDRDFHGSECFDEPTILIGWNIIKDKYPNQNIFGVCI
jgi:hypothetical protein